MADLPPLTALRAFWYVAERRSFKAAAEALFVTQAAVSHQIRQLEEALGVSLFERGNREVRLTREGQRLLPYVQQGFSALRAGVTLVKDDADPHVLGLSVLPALAGRWLLPRLGGFHQAHPDVRVQLQPDDQLETFSDGTMDLAIRYGRGRYPGLRSELILRDSRLVVAAPEFVAAQQPTLDNLGRLPRLEESGPDAEPGWATWSEAQGVLVRSPSVLSVADPSLLIDGAVAGQGLALVRRSLVQDLLDSGRLVRVFEHEIEVEQGYYLVAPEAHFVRAKVRFFVQWLREEIRQSFGPDMGAYHGT
ncbi:LysR family transcriptional regulator [Natronospirillum operosum]|uniref:LysR family transcriptional regulator n=1 Tax=Natronospirillum operosum TaxID=2759953 RepID=A0A4Z0WG13_9GAMM|nr:LysR substrate-binding domain-containing protein [Natronospirillum operosum]TGG94111.1 LysR family transcriptional regulator [Natronospirillum operosum]